MKHTNQSEEKSHFSLIKSFLISLIPFLKLYVRKRREKKLEKEFTEKILKAFEIAEENFKDSTSIKHKACVKSVKDYEDMGISKSSLERAVYIKDFLFYVEQRNDSAFSLRWFWRDPSFGFVYDFDAWDQDEAPNIYKIQRALKNPEEEPDWFEMSPEGITRDMAIDFLNEFLDHHEKNLALLKEKERDKKRELAEESKTNLKGRFKNYEIISCPTCAGSNILHHKRKDSYVQCDSCEEDLVYVPSHLYQIDGQNKEETEGPQNDVDVCLDFEYAKDQAESSQYIAYLDVLNAS